MNIKDCITQYKEIFDETPWYGPPILQSLKVIPFSLWDQKPSGVSHSITELVYHMMDWTVFVIEKLKGNLTFTIELNSIQDWRSCDLITSDKEKKEVIDRFKKVQEEVVKQLNQKSDAWLNNLVLGKTYSNKYMITGLIQHNIYHLGQINMLYHQLK